MALRKPLVLSLDGKIPEELSSADTLDAVVSTPDTYTLTNSNASAIVIGSPVYKTGTAGACDLARANASGTFDVIGLVGQASIANGASGPIRSDGVLGATTAQWDAVTGQTGGLTPGAVYFLDAAAAGKLTATAPAAAGSYLVRIGIALSATDLDISIERVAKRA